LFGSLGEVVLELLLLLGFMLLSPVPGAFDVSVVEPVPVCVLSTGPVAGAAGRVWSMPVLEPVVLLEVEPAALPAAVPLVSRPRSRGAFVSEELDWRIELSVAVRPAAWCFDFALPILLQSQSHLSSFAAVSEEDATLRSDFVADEELEIEPRSEVLLSVGVVARGCVLSGGAAVSFGGFETLALLGRSSRVCAIAAGAARARARIEVRASFIGASVRV
jgi:hypothetical protein